MTDIQASSPESSFRQRLVYIDNLRVFLTILVIIQHLIVAYGGGSGNWYYNDPTEIDDLSWYVLTYLWLINQSFFMSFFFLLSSYFIPPSFDKKGGNSFMKERLQRLGIPLIGVVLLINPVLSFLLWLKKGFEGNYWDFLVQYVRSYRQLDVGVMWFVETLLIFTTLYAVWRWRASTVEQTTDPKNQTATPVSCPSNSQIFLWSGALGIVLFLLRVWPHQNPILKRLSIPQEHFVQYIAFFVVGILAYQRRWLTQLSSRQGFFWTRLFLGLAIALPGILISAGILEGKFSPYAAGFGWNWQSLLIFSFWEQLMCTSAIMTLLFWFRERCSTQGKLAKIMARDTYAVYVTHAVVVTFLVFALRHVVVSNSLVKFVIAAPIAIFSCFAIGHIVRSLPLIRKIL